jgi:uncharacterized protein (TIGR02265 family)
MKFELELDTQVGGDLDLESFIEWAPSDVYVRGMFIARAQAMLGARYESLRPLLLAPPRGNFTAFTAYPIKDFHRVTIEAARMSHRGASDVQAVRLFARKDIEVYATSTLGRVTMSVVSSPGDLIQRFESVYASMAPGPWGMSAERVGPRAARVTVRKLAGVWTYIIGQCEGVCTSMGYKPRVTGTQDGKSLDFTITW